MSFDPAIKANKDLFLSNTAFEGKTGNATTVSIDGAKLPSQLTQDGFVNSKKQENTKKGIMAAVGAAVIGVGVYLLTKGKNKKILNDAGQETAENISKKAANKGSKEVAQNEGFFKKVGDFFGNLFSPSNTSKVDDTVAKQNIDEGMDSINKAIDDMSLSNDIDIDNQNTQRLIDAYDEEAAQVLKKFEDAAGAFDESIPTKIDDVVPSAVNEAAIKKILGK